MVCAAGATADRDARRAPARALTHDIDNEQEHKQKYYDREQEHTYGL